MISFIFNRLIRAEWYW